MTRLDERLRAAAPPRVGPFEADAFSSPLHEVRTAAWLGVALGITFTVCFLTGMLSHLIQHPPSWFVWGPTPSWVYRLTQGVHVTTGIASIPLLLAKLWTVYPRLWTWPPVEGLAHAIERLALLPLVGGSLFLLFSGVASIARWYPFSFSFPPAHYGVAWITIGALIVHVGAKIGATRLALRSRAGESSEPEDTSVIAPGEDSVSGALGRRGFIAAVAGTSAALVVATVGQTLRALAPVSVLAPRDPRVGPQGIPVNKTAAKAGVTSAAQDPNYALRVEGPSGPLVSFTLAELRAMPQRTAVLPIACVDGWSAVGTWRGVPVRTLVSLAGASTAAQVRVESLQRPGSAYATSIVNPAQLADLDTILALELDGEPLDLDHGYPVRLIGPNRPGVQQTKWVARVVVV